MSREPQARARNRALLHGVAAQQFGRRLAAWPEAVPQGPQRQQWRRPPCPAGVYQPEHQQGG
eukprot:5403996-Alexandrium_andersonii.AAC.1